MKRRVRHLSHPLFFLPIHSICISTNCMKSRICHDGLEWKGEFFIEKAGHEKYNRKCSFWLMVTDWS